MLSILIFVNGYDVIFYMESWYLNFIIFTYGSALNSFWFLLLELHWDDVEPSSYCFDETKGFELDLKIFVFWIGWLNKLTDFKSFLKMFIFAPSTYFLAKMFTPFDP